MNGVAVLSVTFNTAGSQTLTVTDTTNTKLDTTATVKVVDPTVATQLQLLRFPTRSNRALLIPCS